MLLIHQIPPGPAYLRVKIGRLALFHTAREADYRELAEQAREVAASLPK
jgi:hypothetical protein